MDDVGRSEPQDPAPERPSADGGPPGVVAAVAVVAVVAVVGLIGWLVSRGDDPQDIGTGPEVITTEPPGTSVPDLTAPGGSTPLTETVVPPSTAGTAGPETVLTTLPPTSPPPTPAPPTTPAPTAAPTIPPDTTLPATVAPVEPPATGGNPGATIPGDDPGDGDPDPDGNPDDGVIDEATELVPNLAAFPEYISDQAQLTAIFAELLATRRHEVASLTPVATLCVAVPLEGSIRLAGRWELDGRPLSSLEIQDVDPPGYATCIDEDGEPLADGAYQFLVIDESDVESAAGTFVTGAARVEQQFRNNGDEDVCAILISPATADYFEAYRVAGPPPLEPGDVVTIPIADVRQDVRTIGCDADAELAEFSFNPSEDEPRDLVP